MVEQVGRYKIKGQLGRGAMGVVYLADDPLLNRQAAIKTVDLSGGDPGQVDFLRTRLLRDARAAAGLSHANIVAVFDVVEEGPAAYLVMEYVPGETLSDILNRTVIPDPAFTLRVLRDMAAALDYTHARGIIHRDIKPANVMIDTTQTAKIMDFGIARIADTRTSTPTGLVMGTIEYMSPEQVKGEAVDGRSDQFALAAVAFRMLSGTTVFGQHSLATLAYKIVNEPPPAVRLHNAGLPAAVDSAVSKALSKSPADRFANCTEFVNALAAALSVPGQEAPTVTLAAPVPPPPVAPLPTSALRPPPAAVPVPAPVPKAPPKSSQAAIVTFAAVLVLGAAGLGIWRWRQTAAPSAGASAPVETAKPPARPPAAPVSDAKPPASHPTTAKTEPPAAESAEEAAPGAESSAAEPVPKEIPKPVAEAHKQGIDLLADNRADAAIAAFTKAIQLRPDWPASYFDRGRAYQKEGDLPAAVRDYSEFLKMRPQNANAHTNRAQCYVRLKDDDHALEDFNAAIALKADAPVAFYGRGLLHMRRHGYRAALDDFDAAIRLNPKYAVAYNARANARRQIGDEAGAEADLRKARELQSK